MKRVIVLLVLAIIFCITVHSVSDNIFENIIEISTEGDSLLNELLTPTYFKRFRDFFDQNNLSDTNNLNQDHVITQQNTSNLIRKTIFLSNSILKNRNLDDVVNKSKKYKRKDLEKIHNYDECNYATAHSGHLARHKRITYR